MTKSYLEKTITQNSVSFKTHQILSININDEYKNYCFLSKAFQTFELREECLFEVLFSLFQERGKFATNLNNFVSDLTISALDGVPSYRDELNLLLGRSVEDFNDDILPAQADLVELQIFHQAMSDLGSSILHQLGDEVYFGNFLCYQPFSFSNSILTLIPIDVPSINTPIGQNYLNLGFIIASEKLNA